MTPRRILLITVILISPFISVMLGILMADMILDEFTVEFRKVTARMRQRERDRIADEQQQLLDKYQDTSYDHWAEEDYKLQHHWNADAKWRWEELVNSQRRKKVITYP